MGVQERMNDFVTLGESEGSSSRYPRFRWIFPIFYAMTTAGFIKLIAYRLENTLRAFSPRLHAGWAEPVLSSGSDTPRRFKIPDHLAL